MNDNQVHPEGIQPLMTEIERLRAEVAELNQCNRLAVAKIAILEAVLNLRQREAGA